MGRWKSLWWAWREWWGVAEGRREESSHPQKSSSLSSLSGGRRRRAGRPSSSFFSTRSAGWAAAGLALQEATSQMQVEGRESCSLTRGRIWRGGRRRGRADWARLAPAWAKVTSAPGQEKGGSGLDLGEGGGLGEAGAGAAGRGLDLLSSASTLSDSEVSSAPGPTDHPDQPLLTGALALDAPVKEGPEIWPRTEA